MLDGEIRACARLQGVRELIQICWRFNPRIWCNSECIYKKHSNGRLFVWSEVGYPLPWLWRRAWIISASHPISCHYHGGWHTFVSRDCNTDGLRRSGQNMPKMTVAVLLCFFLCTDLLDLVLGKSQLSALYVVTLHKVGNKWKWFLLHWVDHIVELQVVLRLSAYHYKYHQTKPYS